MKRSLIFSTLFLTLLLAAPPALAQESALKLPPHKKVTLKNGMTLLLMEQHEVPIVSFSFIVKSGATADPAGKEGLASMTAGLLRKGTKTRTADQLSAELDFIGGLLGAAATPDYTAGSAEFVKKDLAKGLELLSDVMLNPTFPTEEFTKLQRQRVDAIRAAKDEAQGVIGNYFNSYLFGGHLYGRPSEGSEKSIAALAREDVTRFYQTHYVPSNVILAVAGDFATAEMEKMLTDRFGAWSGKPAPAVKLETAAAAKGKRLLLVDKPDATQTFFRIGNVGVARTNEDRVPLQVINTLFGGRFTSMLNTELRINSGLSYGARSSFEQLKTPGPFFINTYTRNEATAQAIDMALNVLKRLHEKGITEEELRSAKAYVKGQYPPRIETTDQLASLMAQLEFFGLDQREVNDFYGKVDAVTMADVRRVVKQYFPSENLVFVLIGKASEIEPVVKKYAPVVDRKSISEPGF